MSLRRSDHLQVHAPVERHRLLGQAVPGAPSLTEFSCPEHGFLVEAIPSAVVTCKCGEEIRGPEYRAPQRAELADPRPYLEGVRDRSEFDAALEASRQRELAKRRRREEDQKWAEQLNLRNTRLGSKYSEVRVPPPTLARLVKHAKLCGIDCVVETADAFLDSLELVRLKVQLISIANQHRRARKPRIWWENPPRVGKVDALLLHDVEDLTPEEIASAMGVKVGTVRKWLYGDVLNLSDRPASAPSQAVQSGTQREKAGKTAQTLGKSK